jgi:predicted anti-sigma-YlaC factor YlaD
MDCTACREAISALLDDEAPGSDPALVEAHLAYPSGQARPVIGR